MDVWFFKLKQIDQPMENNYYSFLQFLSKFPHKKWEGIYINEIDMEQMKMIFQILHKSNSSLYLLSFNLFYFSPCLSDSSLM